jgi:hypothetical protein
MTPSTETGINPHSVRLRFVRSSCATVPSVPSVSLQMQENEDQLMNPTKDPLHSIRRMPPALATYSLHANHSGV